MIMALAIMVLKLLVREEYVCLVFDHAVGL